MWISVAFPTCPSCHNNSHTCFHRNCPNGAKEPMEIDPETSYVKCPSCNKSWHIKQSNYYCSCNYVFSAEDVSVEIDAIVANAKLIARELERNIASKNRIKELTDNAIETKTKNIIKTKFGEKVWTVLKNILPTIVAVVRTWLKI